MTEDEMVGWHHQFNGFEFEQAPRNRWGNSGNSDRLFSWAPKSLQMVTAARKLKDAYSLEKKF